MRSEPFYRSYLVQELSRRRDRNSRYSLRAFAANLDVDPGALSRLLAGKQALGVRAASRITERLELSPLERKRFLESTLDDRIPTPADVSDVPVEIAEVQFRIISDLAHFAVLELVEVQGFVPTESNVAKRLGLSVGEARGVIERLIALGLLRREGKRLLKTGASHAVANKEITTPALRRQQRQILARASQALDTVSIDKRVANSITMAIDPEKLPVARRLIIEFCRALAATLEAGRPERVYQLHVSLFPLDENPKCPS